MKSISKTLIVSCIALLAGCSGEDANDDGKTAERWDSLLSESWSLEAGSEIEDHCVKIQLEEDVYVSAIRPVAPMGTHHTFVALSDTADVNGCTLPVGQGGMVYASGAGSNGLTLPKGVAMKLPKGKFLNFSLHLYNPTKSPLSGTSGLEVLRVPAEEVEHEAGTTLAGPILLQIPPSARTTLRHQCQVTKEQTAFALFPHMHQLGTHFKTTVTLSGTQKVIHDGVFDFNEQLQLPIEPLSLKPGDKIETECTYTNPTARTVTFGESSDTEMCFSVLFGYPLDANVLCGLVEPPVIVQ